MSEVRDDCRYTQEHEWLRLEDDGTVTIGITDHAQEELSDVVFVELPAVGLAVGLGDAIAVVESVKAASDIYAPINGKVVEINTEVEGDPSIINGSPYGDGWIFKLSFEDESELEDLLDAGGYEDLIH